MTRLLLVAAVAIVAVLAGTAMGDEWHAYPGEGTPIQTAIDDAGEGDTIYVHAGAYDENLVVYKSLTLIGVNRSTTFINGNGSADIIMVTADGCAISGFTIEGADDCDWKWKTLATDEVWVIGGGFALTPSQIDVDSGKVWFSFTKNGKEYDSEVISVGDACTFTADRGCEEDVPVILCYVVGVFREMGSNLVQIKYILFNDHALGIDTGDLAEETTGLWPIAGIKLNYVDNNVVTDNEIRLCDCGIRLQYSDNNILTANVASDNNRGISLRGSSDNTLYHNNLINNTNYNAFDECTNTWDSGSVGNYYSDYNGTDPNGDGIGEDPYSIPGGGGSVDNCPLMYPWTGGTLQKGDLNGDNKITPADAAIALAIAASGGWDADADVSGDNCVTSLDALMILQECRH